MARKPIVNYLAPALLAVNTALAAGNWSLQPGRSAAWATAVFLLGGMTLALLVASGRSPSQSRLPGSDESTRRDGGDPIRSAIVFGGLMVLVSLSVKLAAGLGAAGDVNLSRRATMAILGAFLVFTGNSLPKTLTPLSALQCDAGRAQAFQRFAGWTWVLTGLALAVVWLVLPVKVAEPMTFFVVPGGMLIIVAQVVRLRWTRPKTT